MKNRGSIENISEQLERRRFFSYVLAAGVAMACRPVYVQSIMAPRIGIGASEGEVSARTGARNASGPFSQAPDLTLFLCGDVMTGRGIDQILPYPGNPTLYERYMKSARGYAELAEEANGPIPKPVNFSYIWGDAFAELARAGNQSSCI